MRQQRGDPHPQCTLTGSQSKHGNQLIVPLPELLLYNRYNSYIIIDIIDIIDIIGISSTQMREVYQAIL